jgi:hypothetical protein
MYRFFTITLVVIFLGLTSCEPERVTIQSGVAGFDGYHVGYSWAGEARGTAFEDAGAYIETILKLDEDANILDARMRYFQRSQGYWTTRQSGQASVSVNFSVEPTLATIGNDSVPGDSMFSIFTVNLMSLWAAAVDEDGTVAVTVVEPLTRYRFEMKFPAGFDFRTTMSEVNINSGLLVPVQRTAGGNFIVPETWEDLGNVSIFDFHRYSHVLNDHGIWAGLDGSSTVRAFLQGMGITFAGDAPEAMPVAHGFFGIGGWEGNYDRIAAALIGQNARSNTSLIDWSQERFSVSINEDNFFGVDVPSGATRTVQNSFDGISGATVRMSRESTSYQRALVDAGIISESDVIVGRF